MMQPDFHTGRNGRLKDRNGRGRRMLRLGVLVFFAAFCILPPPAMAHRCDDCTCEPPQSAFTAARVTSEHIETRLHFGMSAPMPPGRGKMKQHGTGRLGLDQNWWIDLFFIQYILRAMQLMTEQFVSVMMLQAFSVGAMIDAQNQQDAQLSMEKLKARAHKDYQPSLALCTIGTGVRSLATAEHNANLASTVFGNRVIERHMGSGKILSQFGPADDYTNRVLDFRRRYCDRNDNNRLSHRTETGLELVCQTANGSQWIKNQDIDFTRTVMTPKTLQIDMAEPSHGKPEPLFAMATYLYGNTVLPRMQRIELQQLEAIDEIVDYRALAAKRSVAQNSFDAIMGLKAMGSRDTGGSNGSAEKTMKYMSILMEDMGMTAQDVARVIGPELDSAGSGRGRPSYFAQLEYLAKTIHQRPQFYVDLYDKPANVERRKVAMRAVNTMLDREIYNSYLRSEAILSQILELRMVKEQEAVENRLRGLPISTE